MRKKSGFSIVEQVVLPVLESKKNKRKRNNKVPFCILTKNLKTANNT